MTGILSEDVRNSKRLSAPDDFCGPVRRKHTDVLFALLLLVSWAGMSYLGYIAVENGDLDNLINGVDYNGDTCGVSSSVADLPNIYYIRFDGTGACVETCPETTDWNTLYTCIGSDSDYALGGAQQLQCLGADASKCAELTGISDITSFNGTGDGTCMYQIESVSFLNHCIYIDTSVLSVFETIEEDASYIQQYITDIYTARNWILGFGFGVSFLMGFIVCMFLRIPGVVTIFTWGSIFLVISLFISLGYGCWYKAIEWESAADDLHSDTTITAAKVFAIIFYVFGGLFACFSVFMCRRIQLAASIMTEAARAISEIPMMVFMPIVEALGIVLFFVPLTYYGVYIASMGDISTVEINGLMVKSIEFSDEIQDELWYLLFCFFWTSQFILAMGEIVIALTIVTFYFTRDKSSIGNGTFFYALGMGMFYHMGTAAFGGLVIAIIQMIRAVIAYIQKKVSATGNKFLEGIACCCQCCFWCLEKLMKFVNKNAYIQTALFSTGYCESAKEAFFLVARNILRVGAVTVISDFIEVLMKILICLSTMAATYVCLNQTMSDELYSLIGPVIFVGILAYLVSSVFAELFSMTTTTLIQCYIADEEMFPCEQRYARNEMKEFMHANCRHDSEDEHSKLVDPGTT